LRANSGFARWTDNWCLEVSSSTARIAHAFRRAGQSRRSRDQSAGRKSASLPPRVVRTILPIHSG
jgi:hypothetical protein